MSRTQNVSEQNQKLFLCPGHKICVRNKCCACGQTGKHLCRQQCVLVSFTSTLKVNKFSIAVHCSALVVSLKIVKSEGKHRYTRPLSNQKEREKWITWIGRKTELSGKTHTICFSNRNFWPVKWQAPKESEYVFKPGCYTMETRSLLLLSDWLKYTLLFNIFRLLAKEKL